MSEIINTEQAKKLSLSELGKRLSTSDDGLSGSEAQSRLAEYGYNELAEKKVSPFLKFLGYFWGPIPWMIEIAIVLSAIVSHWEDFIIILALLLINATVGFLQERRAANAIELLKKRLAPTARVRRDGKWQELAARELVPGDLVRMRLGDIVPADVKLAKGDYLSLDESALTGESLPAERHEGDVAYSGSIIRQGEMGAFVVATGSRTYFGKTVQLVEGAKTTSHFQKAVIKIGDYLIILAAILVPLVSIVSLIRGQNIIQILVFALVLVVASIPVALPAVLTVTMAVGATNLARKEAIVRKLVAIEEMAGADVLCADKTGTITQNKLSVESLQPFGDFTEEDVVLVGALASREEDQDPIDNAVLAKAQTMEDVEQDAKEYEVSGFKPFDPVVKRTQASVEKDGKRLTVAKGAPQAIAKLISNNDKLVNKINKAVDDLAAKGFRPLGTAKTDDEGKWRFVGLFGILDPPRDDSAETIKTAEKMGVDIKMVTGDHEAIAKQISKQVGLGQDIITADKFIDKPDDEAVRIVEKADGFARVFPEHKYRIVELLQNRDHIVGMTGDGVNDAPALRKANAGVAVAGAADAAKSAAHLVLTRPGLSVIVDAIRQSRRMFERMNTYATYRIAETIQVLVFISLSILVLNVQPVTAVMLVFLSLLNDLPIMTIAYDNTKVAQKPVRWNMHMVMGVAIITGAVNMIVSFGILLVGLFYFKLPITTLQTLVFLKLAVAGHATIYLMRSGQRNFWSRPYPAGILLGATEGTQIFGTLVAVYGIFMPPIGWGLAIFVWLYSLAFFLIVNYVQRFAYTWATRKYKQQAVIGPEKETASPRTPGKFPRRAA